MTEIVGPYWYMIEAAPSNNYIINPSFEFGGTTWGTTGSIGSAAATPGCGVFGALGMQVVPLTGSVNAGIVQSAGTQTALSGSYTLSCYVRAVGTTGTIRLEALGASTTLGTATVVSSNRWARVSVSVSVTTNRVVPRITNASSLSTLWIDGVVLEPGSVATTYFDGDQAGCRWLGNTHQSVSERTALTRLGGKVVSFADIGFTVDESVGVGAPTWQNIAQSYALIDGADFQRQRSDARSINLTSTITGTSWSHLHQLRRTVIEKLRLSNTPVNAPFRLLYTGATGTSGINVYWSGGMEFGETRGFTEDVLVQCTAYDPYWTDQTQEGTRLVPAGTLPTIQGIVYRDPLANYGTIPVFTTGTYARVYAVEQSPDLGTLYFGGAWGSQSTGVARTNSLVSFSNNVVGSLVAGSLNPGIVRDLSWDFSEERLLVAGSFGGLGGTSIIDIGFVKIGTAFGTLGWSFTSVATQLRGTYHEVAVFERLLSGSYIVAGNFGSIDGVALGSSANVIVLPSSLGAHGTLHPPGTLVSGYTNLPFPTGEEYQNSAISAFTQIGDALYFGGNFTAVGGTIGDTIAVFRRGQWGTAAWPIVGTLPGYVSDIIALPNTSIYAGVTGTVENPVNGTADRNDNRFRTLAKITGSNVTMMGSIDRFDGGTIDSLNGIRSFTPETTTRLWAVGDFSVISGDIPVSVPWVRVTSSGVLPGELLAQTPLTWAAYGFGTIPNRPTVASGFYTIFTTRDGTTIAAGDFRASNIKPHSIGTLINSGMAEAYPILRLHNNASGTARIYQLANLTTNDYVWFNCQMVPFEIAQLSLIPGSVSFVSNIRGNLLNEIIGGSNITSWRLLPGTNRISFLADNDDLRADIWWTPRHQSADGGGRT
jgi:hypothetical protein